MKIKEQIEKYKCERCGHIWITRIKTMPKFCPKCKSLYWNRERVSKKKEGNFDKEKN